MPLVARVLIDSPLPQLDRLFDYAIPPALQPDARPGVRVKVPLRSAGRMVEGYLVEVVDRPDWFTSVTSTWGRATERRVSRAETYAAPGAEVFLREAIGGESRSGSAGSAPGKPGA